MERLLQYLDDLDDLFYAVALAGERIRRFLRASALIASSILLELLFIKLALNDPPLAMAIAALLTVGLLYRGVVYGGPGQTAAA